MPELTDFVKKNHPYDEPEVSNELSLITFAMQAHHTRPFSDTPETRNCTGDQHLSGFARCTDTLIWPSSPAGDRFACPGW